MATWSLPTSRILTKAGPDQALLRQGPDTRNESNAGCGLARWKKRCRPQPAASPAPRPPTPHHGEPARGGQYGQGALWWAVTDGTAFANTTTETIVFPNVTIPANHMADGRFLIIKAYGKLSTTAPPTIIFGLRWGGVAGTLLAVTEALTNGSGGASVNWALEAGI